MAASESLVKVLVTGATGFVGGALTRRLLGDGFSVQALVREPSQVAALSSIGAEAHLGTIGDPNEIAAAAEGCQFVVHCAGSNSHRSAKRALDWINIAGTENVINAARHAGCKRMVHLSCADVTLLNCDRIHWNEEYVPREKPLDECACSKLLAEDLAIAASSHSLEITIIRPAWIWGPGDFSVLPQLCLEAESGPISMHGNGQNLIATIYIDNLVDALVSALTAKNVAGKAYYVTDGEFIDVSEFLGPLCKSVGLPPPRSTLFTLAYAVAWVRELLKLDGPWRTDVVRRGRNSQYDIQYAIKDLNYEPRISLAEGMQALADWVKQEGGPKQIALKHRKPASAESVEAQVQTAKAARK